MLTVRHTVIRSTWLSLLLNCDVVVVLHNPKLIKSIYHNYGGEPQHFAVALSGAGQLDEKS